MRCWNWSQQCLRSILLPWFLSAVTAILLLLSRFYLSVIEVMHSFKLLLKGLRQKFKCSMAIADVVLTASLNMRDHLVIGRPCKGMPRLQQLDIALIETVSVHLFILCLQCTESTPEHDVCVIVLDRAATPSRRAPAMQASPASFALTGLVWSSHVVLSVVSQALYTKLSPPQAFAQSLLQSHPADCVSSLCFQHYSETI